MRTVVHVGIIIVFAALIGLGIAKAQNYCGGLVAVSSATPTPGATPAPPTLSSPFVVTDGAVFSGNGCTIHAGDSTDNTACIQAILNGGHDLDVKTGVYRVDTTGSPAGINVPSGRNIYCENTPPATQTSPLAANLTAPITVSGAWSNGAAVAFHDSLSNGQLFAMSGNNVVYGCQFRGTHYPNATWTADSTIFEKAIAIPSSANNVTIEENDFQGWGGTVGPITNSPTNGQLVPTGMLITYNSFRNGGVRGAEIDGGQGQITHNYFLDAPSETEINSNGGAGPMWVSRILWDSNWFHYVVGGNGGNSPGCFSSWGGNRSTGGVVEHSPGPSDYHDNTFSNNYIDGAFASCLPEAAGAGGVAGVFRNNACTGGCTRSGSGNPNANFWGPGSNE